MRLFVPFPNPHSNLHRWLATELIQSINRDPERYRGLEMCLCRLKEKVSNAANGERLFRSARNRKSKGKQSGTVAHYSNGSCMN